MAASRFHPYRSGPPRLGARIGGGAFAEVFAARSGDGRALVVKLARPVPLFDDGATNAVFAARGLELFTGSKGDWAPDPRVVLEAEAAWLARAKHPAFVALLGAAEIDGRFALVLEPIEGETWRAALLRDARPSVEHVLALARALEAVGLRHGDLKPENLMLEPSGAVRVLDPTAEIEDATHRLLTPAYNPAMERSDVPSLGLLLFEVLTGVAPCVHERDVRAAMREQRARLEALGPSLAGVVLGALGLGADLAPSAPFAGPADFARALEAAPRA